MSQHFKRKVGSAPSENFHIGPKVQLLSDREAVVEGCRAILNYDADYIRLNVGCGTVAFCGNELRAEEYSGDTVILRGKIRTVELGMIKA